MKRRLRESMAPSRISKGNSVSGRVGRRCPQLFRPLAASAESVTSQPRRGLRSPRLKGSAGRPTVGRTQGRWRREDPIQYEGIRCSRSTTLSYCQVFGVNGKDGIEQLARSVAGQLRDGNKSRPASATSTLPDAPSRAARRVRCGGLLVSPVAVSRAGG
jgi:hypothetical protein